MPRNELASLLAAADFRTLFVEMGWNAAPPASRPFRVDLAPVGDAAPKSFLFREVASLGPRVWECRLSDFPTSAERAAIDSRLRKLGETYLAVFTVEADPSRQLWMVPVRSVERRKLVVVPCETEAQRAFLLEKLGRLSFPIGRVPGAVEVIETVEKTFLANSEEVTRKFYQAFRKQHDAFVKGVRNVGCAEDREWYASVMLNRLMFCYFIQKKRFLDFNENYLRDRLAQVQAKRGQDRFYETFYRSFLKQLFSDGLDKPVSARSDYFLRKYGRIPYLNGGMFSMHRIERENKDIDIPDAVFESLFAFFDQWHWHLDNRLSADGKDINPDVLGYIFEQYINDRAQMGAYYTKEDITEYIGRNTIVPWVWEKATGGSAVGDAAGWRETSDRYVFPAMRKGVDLSLPPEIARGVDIEPQATLRARRAEWNKPAAEEFALPTEIWRETVERRRRVAEIRERIVGGGIKDIRDFVTYNLDIRTFVEDVVRKTDDHRLVLHFYKTLREVTVLDPTCGSGAFLFAALNILEPLYEACLDRMEEFHARNANLFKDELAEIAGKFRSNRQYFIYKNVILRNLYGVDIMHEAVEIARLRLFLKMVSVVDVDPADENLGLDPLPDIDFNIRCGNTLVGYATQKQIQNDLAGDLFAYNTVKTEVENEMTKASKAFEFFRREQLNLLGDHRQLVDAKKDINERLAAIRKILDSHLYASSGGGKKKEQWLHDVQPFHWYTEFYPIMHERGGFDVIVGNPPYVEYSKVKDYKIKDYKTESCGNLYAFVVERCYTLISRQGQFGMIVPISCISTERMKSLRAVWKERNLSSHISLYSADAHPSILFNGVKFRLAIVVQTFGDNTLFTTHFQRWYPEYRDCLFQCISFTNVNYSLVRRGLIPKLVSPIHAEVFTKVCSNNNNLAYFITENSPYTIYAHRIVAQCVKALNFVPYFCNARDGEKKSEDYKTFPVADKSQEDALCAVLNSNLFYSWFVSYSDVYHCGREIILDFPADLSSLASQKFGPVVKRYMNDLIANKVRRQVPYKNTGLVVYDEFYPRKSKSIIDEIDELLAKHYGFTEEELDFIINYDIKYRMGDELNAGGGE